MGLEDREWFRADQKQRLGRNTFWPLRSDRLNKWYIGVVGLAVGIPLATLFPIHGPALNSNPGMALTEESDSSPWPFPPQGAVQFHVSNLNGLLGTLTIVAPSHGPERHFVIRVRDWYQNTPVSTLYLRTGETLNVDLPIGAYRLSFAEGTGWQGYDQLFGSSTVFSVGAQPIVITPGQGGIVGVRLAIGNSPVGNFPKQPSSASSF